MSEEVGKALQSVVERVNQAAARRPKVTAGETRLFSSPSAASPLSLDVEIVLLEHDALCKAAENQPLNGRQSDSWQHFQNSGLLVLDD